MHAVKSFQKLCSIRRCRPDTNLVCSSRSPAGSDASSMSEDTGLDESSAAESGDDSDGEESGISRADLRDLQAAARQAEAALDKPSAAAASQALARDKLQEYVLLVLLLTAIPPEALPRLAPSSA